MSERQRQPEHVRPRAQQDDTDAGGGPPKRARTTATATAATMATTTTSERPLASIGVRELLSSPSSGSQQQQQQAATVSQPVQLGCWTRLSRLSGLPMERRFLYGDRSGLPRLRLPAPARLPASLDEGYPDRFVRKPEGERSGVEAVVRGAVHPSTAPSPMAVAGAAAGAAGTAAGGGSSNVASPASSARGGIDWSFIHVCTYRNNLNKILGVPIDQGPRADGWCIDAVLLAPPTQEKSSAPPPPPATAAAAAAMASAAAPHRVLFLDIQPDPGGERTFPGQDRFMYYGYKLETLCTEERKQELLNGAEGGVQQQPPLVDSTSEFAALVAVRVGRHRVLMAAEIDAEEEEPDATGPSPPLNNSAPLARLAEIKCYRPPPAATGPAAPPTAAQRAAATLYRLKHQRWWVQSFLAGVPTLVLGARDDRGNLVSVSKVPVASLQELSRRHGFPWEGGRLVAFGDAALAWMRAVAERAGEGAHVRFVYDPRAGELRASVVEGGGLAARVRGALAKKEDDDGGREEEEKEA